ncbi:MAG TPA: UV DNA damage repair endonuclease UvsE [Ohtaekwangia sp.]|nr:UV DNA damage repair endonuclease UvsE [Ohtaekwangia sp.]
MRIGYACLNNTLAIDKIKVNRSCIRKTFLEKGIAYASSLALQNIIDLEFVVEWNIQNAIPLYRMSSDMFPWMSEYELGELPEIERIETILRRIGEKVKQHHHRLTYHPGPFNVLASPDHNVVAKTSKELRQHAEIMDLMQLPLTPFAKINIHVGGAYGDKVAALDRFALNFEKLPDAVQRRLTIENDDKANMYAVQDLLLLHSKIGIPIVFDYLHHQFCAGNYTTAEAFHAAVSTWASGITPVVHYSSSKKQFEDATAMAAAHADYIYEQIPRYGMNVDIVLEAKAKELAVLRYHDQFESKVSL